MKDVYINEYAVIDAGAKLGAGSRVWHFSHLSNNCEVGKNVSIGQNVFIAPNVKVGDGCKIQNNVSLFEGVILEDDVFCGPSMVFTNVYNPRAFIERKKEYRTTLIKKGVAIGANATIVCGITLGEYSFIGAGAVVNRDVKPYALMAGVVAKQIGWVSKYGLRLDLPLSGTGKAKCSESGIEYELKGDQLIELG